jgi:hypothetical protein
MKKNNILFNFSLSNSSLNISNEFEKKNKINNLNLSDIQNRIYKELPKIENHNIDKIKNYLKYKRKIHKGIVNTMVKNNRIYSDDNENYLFTNKDNTFAVIRNIKNTYKSCTGIPDFIIYKNIQNDNFNTYLFESPIDALSFMSLYPNIKGVYISINGNMMINKINRSEDIRNCKILHLCFDNDEAGEDFCNIVINSNIKEKEMIIKLKPKFKDFNEDLMNLKNN